MTDRLKPPPKHLVGRMYRRCREAQETYAADYVCMACKSAWIAVEYATPYRFCPYCGTEFAGAIPRSSRGEDRHMWRNQAAWRNLEIEGSQKITYGLEYAHERHGDDRYTQWKTEIDWKYRCETSDPKAAIAAWRDRKAGGSWLGEWVRLIARTPSGTKVPFRPVYLNPGKERKRC